MYRTVFSHIPGLHSLDGSSSQLCYDNPKYVYRHLPNIWEGEGEGQSVCVCVPPGPNPPHYKVCLLALYTVVIFGLILEPL